MSDLEQESAPARDAGSTVERAVAIGTGGALLVLALSMCGWAVRLLRAASGPAGWPPGFGQLLIPVAFTVAFAGFGAWRLLRMGLPARIFGLPLGGAVLALFGLAALVGAAI